MQKIFFVISCVLLMSAGIQCDAVQCERIESHDFYFFGNELTCFMNEVTRIDETGIQINMSKNDSIGGMYLYGNRKIEFLPENMNEVFSNLVQIGANDCKIKAISKRNFAKLSKVKYLLLSGNEIETIPNDVFEDMTSLERLYLHRNNIRQVDGEAFAALKALQYISLGRNPCMDVAFFNITEVPDFKTKITEKCGYQEVATVHGVDEIKESANSLKSTDIAKLYKLMTEIADELKKNRDDREAMMKEIREIKLQIEELNLKTVEKDRSLKNLKNSACF